MNTIRAVIVDDNDELRNSMTQYLSAQKDISIVGEAANGQDALKMIQEKQPDVVLLDMIMPMLDGFGVLAQLQRTPLEKRPRVIAVTALGRDDFIRRAVELGVMYYMIKPVELPVLMDRIREVAAHQSAVPLELVHIIFNIVCIIGADCISEVRSVAQPVKQLLRFRVIIKPQRQLVHDSGLHFLYSVLLFPADFNIPWFLRHGSDLLF